MKYSFLLALLLLAGCAKKAPAPLKPVAVELHVSAATAAPIARDMTFSFASGPCDQRMVSLVVLLNSQHVLAGTPCENAQAEPTAIILLHWPNQDILDADHFPANVGEAGFVYAGGDCMNLIYRDTPEHGFVLCMPLMTTH